MGLTRPHADGLGALGPYPAQLEAALGGKAAYLITGNLKHFPPHKRIGQAVLSPTEFIATYRKKQQQG